MVTLVQNRIFSKEYIVEFISLLFIILFTYAAVSKIHAFEIFRIQLGQSPFIGTYANILVWGVPAIELIISLMLFFPRLKLAGLWISFILMVVFTTYIISVLNFSDSIPCSCGGIINSLSWTEHLIFNIGFTALAAIGVSLDKTNRK